MNRTRLWNGKFLNIPYLFWVFLGIVLVVNLLQSYWTELDPDEAYYWMYSRVLDWGYFDHPPMVALMIRVGYWLFPNELGLRLMTLMAQTLTFLGIWFLVDKPKSGPPLILLILLMSAMPFLQVYGFITTPDSPLILFSVYFLLVYKWFVKEENWKHTIMLGILMAALLYSKYHGVLLIFFVLLSNLQLLKKPKFYVASTIGFLLFLPHLYWQYMHDFPSVRYHLKGRDDVYELKHTVSYFINQILIFSPFLFPFILMALRQVRFKSLLNRAYLFVISGFWLFFLWSTFKGHTEPQWNAILSIPFIALLLQYAHLKPSMGKWIKRMAILSAVLLFLARFGLIFDLTDGKSSFHDTKWIQEIEAIADGRPIYFENSYRDPSKFSFYSGKRPFVFTNEDYRKNQFDIWDWEKAIHNQSVLVFANPDWVCSACDSIKISNRTLNKIEADNLQIFSKLKVKWGNQPLALIPNQKFGFNLKIFNPYEFDVQLRYGNLPIEIQLVFFESVESFEVIQLNVPKEMLLIKEGWNEIEVEGFLDEKLIQQNEYETGIGFGYEGFPPSIHSERLKLYFDQ